VLAATVPGDRRSMVVKEAQGGTATTSRVKNSRRDRK